MANRFKRQLYKELICGYRMHFYEGFVNPERELTDSIIYDAEYRQDIERRIEESRHQTALVCVALGLYKDTYEAKQGVRGIVTLPSSIITLSSRQKDRGVRLQVQAFALQAMMIAFIILLLRLVIYQIKS